MSVETSMPAIVEYPSEVRELVEQFGELFPNASAREHFAEYLTGLFIAERKTVSGINLSLPSPPTNPVSIAS